MARVLYLKLHVGHLFDNSKADLDENRPVDFVEFHRIDKRVEECLLHHLPVGQVGELKLLGILSAFSTK